MDVQTISWSDAGDNWDLTFFRGQAAQIVAPRSLGFTSIAGATLVLTVKQHYSDILSILTKSTQLGTITISDPTYTVNVLAGDTLLPTLVVGTYYYDVRRTDAGLETTLTWGRWRMHASAGVL